VSGKSRYGPPADSSIPNAGRKGASRLQRGSGDRWGDHADWQGSKCGRGVGTLIVWYDAHGKEGKPVAVELNYHNEPKDDEYAGGVIRRLSRVFDTIQSKSKRWDDPNPITKTAFCFKELMKLSLFLSSSWCGINGPAKLISTRTLP
jgi:hypothetical protein